LLAYPRKAPSASSAPSAPYVPNDVALVEGITDDEVKRSKKFRYIPDGSGDPYDMDTGIAGHHWLHQQRENLKYLRLIEHDLPRLVGRHFITFLFMSFSNLLSSIS